MFENVMWDWSGQRTRQQNGGTALLQTAVSHSFSVTWWKVSIYEPVRNYGNVIIDDLFYIMKCIDCLCMYVCMYGDVFFPCFGQSLLEALWPVSLFNWKSKIRSHLVGRLWPLKPVNLHHAGCVVHRQARTASKRSRIKRTSSSHRRPRSPRWRRRLWSCQWRASSTGS